MSTVSEGVLPKAEYQNRTGDERLETFSFASKLIPQMREDGFEPPFTRYGVEPIYVTELITPPLRCSLITLPSHKKYYKTRLSSCQVGLVRLELTTCRLKARYSTNWVINPNLLIKSRKPSTRFELATWALQKPCSTTELQGIRQARRDSNPRPTH